VHTLDTHSAPQRSVAQGISDVSHPITLISVLGSIIIHHRIRGIAFFFHLTEASRP